MQDAIKKLLYIFERRLEEFKQASEQKIREKQYTWDDLVTGKYTMVLWHVHVVNQFVILKEN